MFFLVRDEKHVFLALLLLPSFSLLFHLFVIFQHNSSLITKQHFFVYSQRIRFVRLFAFSNHSFHALINFEEGFSATWHFSRFISMEKNWKLWVILHQHHKLAKFHNITKFTADNINWLSRKRNLIIFKFHIKPRFNNSRSSSSSSTAELWLINTMNLLLNSTKSHTRDISGSQTT